MLCSLRRIVAALALVTTLLAVEARAQFADCGTIEQGVTCQKLFRDSSGMLWLLQTYGTYQVGDHVFVTGNPDPSCINICQQGNGCIYQNTIGPCDPTTSFCACTSSAPCNNVDPSAGCTNSTGQGAELSGAGSVSVSADDLVLTVRRLPSNVNGLVFMGPSQINVPFGDGRRCVGTGPFGVFRYPLRNSGTAGTFGEGPIVSWANTHFAPYGGIAPGATWHFQVWYRDPSGPCGRLTNLSNAVSATFTP